MSNRRNDLERNTSLYYCLVISIQPFLPARLAQPNLPSKQTSWSVSFPVLARPRTLVSDQISSLWPVWLGNEPVGPYLNPSLAILPAYIPTYSSQLRVVDPGGLIGLLFRCRVRVIRICCPEISQLPTFTALCASGDPPVSTTDRYRARGNPGGCSRGISRRALSCSCFDCRVGSTS